MTHTSLNASTVASRVPLVLFVFLLCSFAFTQFATAQGATADIRLTQSRLPEVMVVPLRTGLDSSQVVGWVLIYNNKLLEHGAPDLVFEKRSVKLIRANEVVSAGEISWQVVRTKNDSCKSMKKLACPDSIQILSVPDGFMAVPSSATVDEGTVLRIFVVRNELG